MQTLMDPLEAFLLGRQLSRTLLKRSPVGIFRFCVYCGEDKTEEMWYYNIAEDGLEDFFTNLFQHGYQKEERARPLPAIRITGRPMTASPKPDGCLGWKGVNPLDWGSASEIWTRHDPAA
jgi:hypothetical protein